MTHPLATGFTRRDALLGLAGAGVVQQGTTLQGGALAGSRFRILVSTDIGGGDPDDHQSLIHLLQYSDLFDLEGLVRTPPHRAGVEQFHEVIDAYAKDHQFFSKVSSQYPTPERLRSICKQGAIESIPRPGWAAPTDASKWIIECAKKRDPRPLWVLVWGGMSDVAQALHDDPSIKRKVRVISTGAWNTQNDPYARWYVATEHKDLWWIEADTTFRGMYVGGNQVGELGNLEFIARHVAPYGALGKLYHRMKPDIKMGDTPTLTYLFRGMVNDPTGNHWGGAYVKTGHGPNHWTDTRDPDLQERQYPGARTVNRWRVDYLRDWQLRLERIYRGEGS